MRPLLLRVSRRCNSLSRPLSRSSNVASHDVGGISDRRLPQVTWHSSLWLALKLIVGFSLRDVPKAAALIELVRTLVLQSDG